MASFANDALKQTQSLKDSYNTSQDRVQYVLDTEIPTEEEDLLLELRG